MEKAGDADLVLGILSSLNFQLRPMSLFDLIVILTLGVGGPALLLRSLTARA